VNSTEPEDIVGELHFPGDIRDKFDRAVVFTDAHGPVISIAAAYDEDTDLTTIFYAKFVYNAQ
jgi:hypothetical protein